MARVPCSVSYKVSSCDTALKVFLTFRVFRKNSPISLQTIDWFLIKKRVRRIIFNIHENTNLPTLREHLQTRNLPGLEIISLAASYDTLFTYRAGHKTVRLKAVRLGLMLNFFVLYSLYLDVWLLSLIGIQVLLPICSSTLPYACMPMRLVVSNYFVDNHQIHVCLPSQEQYLGRNIFYDVC